MNLSRYGMEEKSRNKSRSWFGALVDEPEEPVTRHWPKCNRCRKPTQIECDRCFDLLFQRYIHKRGC
jgi:ribosomal protein L37E